MTRLHTKREPTVQRRNVNYGTHPYGSPRAQNTRRPRGQRGRHGQRGGRSGQRGRHGQRGGRSGHQERYSGKRAFIHEWRGNAHRQHGRGREEMHPQKLIDELENLQKESAAKIVLMLNDKRSIEKYIKWSYEHRNVSREFIRLLDKAFTCTTTPALLLNILNDLKENEFIRKSLDQLKGSFVDVESDKGVINATATIIRILIWTTQRNPSAVVFLRGSSAFLSDYMESLLESVQLRTDIAPVPFMGIKKEHDSFDEDNLTKDDQMMMIRTDSENAAISRIPISNSQCRNELNDKHCREHNGSAEIMMVDQSDVETCMKESVKMETSQIDEVSFREITNDIVKCDWIDQTTTDQINIIPTAANPSLSPETAFESSSTQSSEITNARKYIKEEIDKPKLLDENFSGTPSCSTQQKSFLESTMRLKLLFDEFNNRLKNYPRKMCQDSEAINLEEFRDIPIFPTLGDINGTIKPKLRAIKAKGAYKNVSDYLDIQFRLLREDYMSPLRDAILTHTGQLSRKDRKKIQDIKLYENVRIVSPIFMDGIKHVIRFDVSKFGNVRWNMSKRLKYGSLVCLSADNFQTCYFATISNSDVRYKRDGILHVQFQHNASIVNELMNNNFTMVESSAYFEAYRHVLACLQKMTDIDFPLTKYIVGNVTEVQPPKYLQNGLAMPNHGDETETLDPDIDSSDSDSLKSLQMFDADAEQFNLDSSQLAAFKAALSSELALIQGPPGCGKTYVGLRIVETLLYNKFKLERRVLGKAQLLVICYTNHALDQFLEGICHFNKVYSTIIRVGARTASEMIEKHTLSTVRKQYRKDNLFPDDIQNRRRAVNANVRKYEKMFNTLAMKMRILKENIASESSLRDFMGNAFMQFRWEKQKMRDQKPWLAYLGNDVMTEWLGLQKIARDISNDTFYRTGDYQYLDHLTDDSIHLENRETISGKTFDYEKEKNLNESIQLEQFRNQNLAVDLDAVTKDLGNIRHYKKEIVRIERERLKKFVRQKLCSATVPCDGFVSDNISDVNVFSERFSEDQRWQLYRTWVDKKCNMLIEEQSELLEKLENACKCKQEMTIHEDSHILKEADVIGMTTTGAAKINATLKQLNPTIIIVEEAAEVLESHLISNLTAKCQHLILIGDHQQLKPKPEVYKLEIDYNLNLSLFERLINNGIKCHTLKVQHRMRPEIAENVRYIYKDLHDHESVKNFDNILGIKFNTFFIQHSVFESKTEELKSFVNEHEALYIVYLCKYLLLQGYPGDKITILTTYKGQMFHIKKEMLKLKDGLENVLVTVVDNYQGEENDIVLISLVRSNSEGRVGFLSVDNRACVALSRAKKGLFAIGNFEQISNASSLWKSVILNMKDKGLYGTELPLICRNHDKDEGILAKSHNDFMRAPEGGCIKPCDIRMDCGHVCNRKCHVTDEMHETTICQKPCTRKCVNGHLCEKLCSQWCICTKSVERKLPCGHKVTIECSKENLVHDDCQEICRKELPCGHPCSKKCCDTCICTVLITKQLVNCGHEVEMLCCVDPGTFRCNQKCEKILPCGHRCSRLCRDKCSPCTHLKKLLRADCGHECEELCGEDIQNTPCDKTCNLIMECGHTCKDICGENKELTTRKLCPNGHKYDCKTTCNFTLSCGHKCNGLCYLCAKNNHHVPCHEELDVKFICGHTSSVACSEIAPCYKSCMRNCRHQICDRKCSNICKPCTKPCAWKCKHYECSKPCGEMCDRPRCFESCEKVLDCGHMCNGLCGDPCPLVCFKCDEMYKNYNERVKYVQLQDCGHIFPAGEMDEYMDGDGDDDFFKRCPSCNIAIVTSNGNRYEKVMNQHWKNLNNFKAKSHEYSDLAWNAYNSLKLKSDITRFTRLSPFTDTNKYIDHLNDEAVLWCAEEIKRRHSYRLCKPNLPTCLHTYSAQGMCDLERRLRLYIDIWTLQHLENQPNLTAQSIKLIAKGWDVIRKYGTYSDNDQDALQHILSSVREQSNLKTGSILINVVMNECLPYMSIQEDVILDEQSNIELHTDDSKKQIFKRQTRIDALGYECSPENDYSYLDINFCLDKIEDIHVEVEQTVNFLVNEVCQLENRTSEKIEEKLFEQEIAHISQYDALNQSPSELEHSDCSLIERHQEKKSPELNKSTLLTTRVESEIPIVDRLQMNRLCVDNVPSDVPLDETTSPKPPVKSTVYTINLMAFPWTKYRSGPANIEHTLETEDSRDADNQTRSRKDSGEDRTPNNACYRKRRLSGDEDHVKSSIESHQRSNESHKKQRSRHVENSSGGRHDRHNKETIKNSHSRECDERKRDDERHIRRYHDSSGRHHSHEQVHDHDEKKHGRRSYERENTNEVRIGGTSRYRETYDSDMNHEQRNHRTRHGGDYSRSGTKRKNSDQIYFDRYKKRR